MNVDYIAELMEKRRARYLAVADVIVETDGKSAGQITDELLDGLKRLDSEKK
jgi:shikimate kinase